MLFNSFFACTNSDIVRTARSSATLIAGAAPYLIPIVQVLIELAFAGIETGSDLVKIKDGYGVTIVKSKSSWSTFVFPETGSGDNTKGVTLDYSEYLRIFLNLNMLGGKEVQKLARIGDCIRVNTNYDLIHGYTMLAVEAKIKAKTTFMKTISEETHSGRWTNPDNTYLIRYQSILGY